VQKEELLLEHDCDQGQTRNTSIPVTEQCDNVEGNTQRESEEILSASQLTSKIRKSFIDTNGDSSFTFYLFLTNSILVSAAQGVTLSENQLPWSKLPKLTADQGLSIMNWPDLVPFPGEKKKITGGGKTQSSIKCLSSSKLLTLYTAF
jgi:hypothetical protein